VDEAQQQQLITELQSQLASSRENGISSAANETPGAQPGLQRATRIVAIQALRDALVVNGDYDREDEKITLGKPTSSAKKQEPLIGTDLISACEQNSLIPPVLAFLRASKRPNAESKSDWDDETNRTWEHNQYTI